MDCFCTCFLLLQVEAIRRAKPIVGDELVDIEYRIFDGPNMLSAETVVETMNRLTEGEMVSTLKYTVRRRSFITSELKVLYYYVGNYYYNFFPHLIWIKAAMWKIRMVFQGTLSAVENCEL